MSQTSFDPPDTGPPESPESFDAYDNIQLDAPEESVLRRVTPLAHLIAQSSDSPVLGEWAEVVFSRLQTWLSLRHAKGLAAEELEREDFLDPNLRPEKRAKAVAKLEDMDTQSLAVHTLNAVMAAWTVVRLARLNEPEQRLVLAGLTLHDLNKMGETTAERRARLEGEGAAAYRAAFEKWADRLNLWAFIGPESWQDIAFLAANAEDVRGENRSLLNYPDLRNDPALLETLAPFVRLGDLVASIAKHPEDVGQGRKLHDVQATLGSVLRHRFRVRHHRVTENRGLLTQVIHNAVLARAEALGWVPWLLFPDGVTYLAPKDAPELELDGLAAEVRHSLTERVKDNLGQLVGRGGKGVDYQPEFAELLPPQAAGRLVISRTFAIISDKKTPVTEDRKAKTVLRTGHVTPLDLHYAGTLDSDRLAEAMFGLSKLLTDYYGGDRQDHGERLLLALGLADLQPAYRAIELTGGVGYPWYYVAGHALMRRKGLSPDELQGRMNAAWDAVVTELGEPQREPPFSFLERYLTQTLSTEAQGGGWDFAGELRRYEGSNARGGQRPCLICNSAFAVRPDYSTYSNRMPVSRRTDARRGICEVCQAEELLRRFSLGQTMREEGEAKFLHLYPTYFFTTVTARAMRKAYQSVRGVMFGELAQAYRRMGRAESADPFEEIRAVNLALSAFAAADPFALEEREKGGRVIRAGYSDTDLQAYYLLGLPFPDQKPSDTETWVMPALLGLLAPIVFGSKVVVSASARPPFATGANFPDKNTQVILDGPHPYWAHAFGKTSFRLTDLGPSLRAAFAVYGLTHDAYKDSRKFTLWNQLGHVAREVESDPLNVFGFADRIASHQKVQSDGMTPWLAQKLLDTHHDYVFYLEHIAQQKGVDRMSMIEGLVDGYATFYRATARSAYARLRPLSLAAEVVLDAPPELGRDDLILQIEGRIHAFLDGVRDRVTQGYIPKGAFTDAERRGPIEAFATLFVTQVFEEYCKGERSVLRKRLNGLKNGAEAVYIKRYARRSETPADPATPAETTDADTPGTADAQEGEAHV